MQLEVLTSLQLNPVIFYQATFIIKVSVVECIWLTSADHDHNHKQLARYPYKASLYEYIGPDWKVFMQLDYYVNN